MMTASSGKRRNAGMNGKAQLQSESDKDQEKGDEVLRRLLKTPPKPKEAKAKPKLVAKPSVSSK